MKIVVAIKQVPDRDAPVRIAADGKWIEERELEWAMNEHDAYALEEALQLKEKHGGEVIVLSAGPERAGSTIREALAKGADRAIHIVADDLGGRDALGVARLLAAAAARDLIEPARSRLARSSGQRGESVMEARAGAGLGALGTPSDTVVAAVACAAALVAAGSDAGVAGFRLPIHGRQVNERWLDRYRAWVETKGSYSKAWREAADESEYVFYVTPAELKELNQELLDLLLPRFRDRLTGPAKRPAGALPVEMLMFTFPVEPMKASEGESAGAGPGDTGPGDSGPGDSGERGNGGAG